jgi:hypothetical protein
VSSATLFRTSLVTLPQPVFHGKTTKKARDWALAAKGRYITGENFNYPGGSLNSLMSHTRISNNLEMFKNDIAAANKEAKEYIFGETNSGMRSPSLNFKQY